MTYLLAVAKVDRTYGEISVTAKLEDGVVKHIFHNVRRSHQVTT